MPGGTVTQLSRRLVEALHPAAAMKGHVLPLLLAACTATTAVQPAPEAPKPATETAKPAPEAQPAVPGFDPSHVLSLRGSNTLGLAYAPKLLRAFLQHEGATEITDRSDLHDKEKSWMTAKLGGDTWWIEIYTPGTKYGFQSLAVGYCDVVLASRPVTADEASKLASLGDMTAPASENVVAMDGIAVIVHPNVTVDQLTMEQLDGIFSGKIKNWSEVGGKNLPIRVFSRDKLSGTHDAFVSLVLNGVEPKAEKLFENSEELSHTVLTTEGAIGFVGLPYIEQTKALAISDDGTQALLPSPFTVATEDYALARRLFMYVPTQPKNPLARKLVDFAMSDAGQVIAGEAGFVPLSLRSEAAHVATSAPSAYRKLATGATRLSLDFRFKLGSASVDNKARTDLDRLTRYLAQPINRGRKLALAGFADAQGSDATNETLAKERAEAIAKLLAQRGVNAEVASFGSAMPVAPNNTPVGRARNRRVEAWLR
jgi:phosphate transport system substrate-binding protein